jgi:hypothetical protein
MNAEPGFVVVFSRDGAELVGARWWNEAFHAHRNVSRRGAMIGVAVGACLAVPLFVLVAMRESDEVDAEETLDALELQRREGWNVGYPAARIVGTSKDPVDVDGNRVWRTGLPELAEQLSPRDGRLQPFYVPTLFQSLASPNSGDLREQLVPLHTITMAEAYRKAVALGELVSGGDAPDDLAVIIDMPGPEAVAAASALARVMTPVFGFGNWPHPVGVVPAHQTLAAVLYYLPELRRAAELRPRSARPLFVLDSNRLLPYSDASSAFDNRYVARLPGASDLAGLGIRRILYVRPNGSPREELDDLNDDFVAYRNAGIDVRASSFGDFDYEAGAPEQRQYWGGYPGTHVHFWPSYGWYRSAPSAPPAGLTPGSSPPRSLPGGLAIPRSVDYRPEPRLTMFSSRTVGGMPGVGKQKPSGFGMISVRRNPSSGAISRVSSGRSGSFGRTYGSGSS